MKILCLFSLFIWLYLNSRHSRGDEAERFILYCICHSRKCCELTGGVAEKDYLIADLGGCSRNVYHTLVHTDPAAYRRFFRALVCENGDDSAAVGSYKAVGISYRERCDETVVLCGVCSAIADGFAR